MNGRIGKVVREMEFHGTVDGSCCQVLGTGSLEEDFAVDTVEGCAGAAAGDFKSAVCGGNIEAVCAQTGQDDLSVRSLYAAAGCGKGIAGDFAVCGGNFERSKGEGIKPGRAVQRAERQLLYGGRHLEGEHLFLVIIAEKMFPEYGRDELFLSQTERIDLNACFEAVRIEVEVPGAKSAEAFRREISIAVMAVEGAYG